MKKLGSCRRVFTVRSKNLFTLHQSVIQNLFNMWCSTFEICVVQLRFDTEITQKSPFHSLSPSSSKWKIFPFQFGRHKKNRDKKTTRQRNTTWVAQTKENSFLVRTEALSCKIFLLLQQLSGVVWTQPYSKETNAPAYLRLALFFKLFGVIFMCYYCSSSKRSLILQVHVPKTCTCQFLLNESETCTDMKAMEKKLDGCCTKMLRMVFNMSWQDKLTNKDYMVIYHQCHQKWVSEGWS